MEIRSYDSLKNNVKENYNNNEIKLSHKKNLSKNKIIIPPIATTIPTKTFSFHDVQIIDEYEWLKDKTNPKVLKYLEEENAYADACMKNTMELQNQLYDEFISREPGDEKSYFWQIDSFYYYTRTEVEKQFPIHCRRAENLDNVEQILLDENHEAEGEDFFCLGAFEISPDHNLLAYGVDTQGNEKFFLRFKNLKTDTMLEDEIYPVSWTIRWAADNNTIFYTKINEIDNRSYRLYKHILGENKTDGSDDELVYEEPDALFTLMINTSSNKKFFFLHIDGQITKEIWYLPTNQPKGNFQLINKRQRGIQYSVCAHGNYFYILTNESGAFNFKVIKVSVEDPGNKNIWEEIIPHREDILIERIEIFKHHLVTWEWFNALQKIRVQNLSDGEVHYVPLGDSPLYAIWPGEKIQGPNDECQIFNSNLLHFTYTSLIQPHILYEYDMDNGRRRKLKERIIPGFIKDQYEQKRIFAKSKDGEILIPISLVYKISLKNSVGGNPLLLVGYGAYGGHKLPSFNADRLSLLDRGIIFAIAHIRGDATMGYHWYQNGKMLNKKNTFNDFIACAEYLIEEGYTTPDKLAIHGRSAGGLLMGAVTNLRPDLFKVVLADVPFLDISSLFDPNVPWTVFEYEEWGDPNDKETFEYMISYSPYHNIESKNYPNMLLTAGLNDPRVSYWEPAKYVAKLRKKKTDNNLLLLKTYLTGHMGTFGRYDAFSELSFQYSFLINKLNVLPPSIDKPLVKLLPPIEVTTATLLSMFQGYQVTMVIYAAIDLALFDHLHAQPEFKADYPTLAKSMGVSLRGLIRLGEALVSIGLLKKEQEYIILTDVSIAHLVQGMPGFIGDLRFALANRYQWDSSRQLAQAIRCGTKINIKNGETESYEQLEHAQESLAQSNYKHASRILQAVLHSWMIRRKRLNILDLCCGNDLMAFSIAEKRKDVYIWSLDTKGVLSNSKKLLEDMKLDNKIVQFQEIENLESLYDTLKEIKISIPFDLIIFGNNVINSLGGKQAMNLLEYISGILTATGRIVMSETISQLDRSPYPYLCSIAMFVSKKKGKVHSLSWYKDLLSSTGFSYPTVHDMQPFSEKLLISNKNIIFKKYPKEK